MLSFEWTNLQRRKSLTLILSQTHSSALTAGPSRTGIRACVSPSGRERERRHHSAADANRFIEVKSWTNVPTFSTALRWLELQSGSAERRPTSEILVRTQW